MNNNSTSINKCPICKGGNIDIDGLCLDCKQYKSSGDIDNMYDKHYSKWNTNTNTKKKTKVFISFVKTLSIILIPWSFITSILTLLGIAKVGNFMGSLLWLHVMLGSISTYIMFKDLK